MRTIVKTRLASAPGEGLRDRDGHGHEHDGGAHEARYRVHSRKSTTSSRSSQPQPGTKMPATISARMARKGTARGSAFSRWTTGRLARWMDSRREDTRQTLDGAARG